MKNFQRALNRLGENLSVDGSFGPLTLAATNRKLQEGKEIELNNVFREEQIKFYKSLTPQFQNWYTSLDRDYPHLYSATNPFLSKDSKYKKVGASGKNIVLILIGVIAAMLLARTLYIRYYK